MTTMELFSNKENELSVANLLLNWQNGASEEDEDERQWRIYRGQPVEPRETMEARCEWQQKNQKPTKKKVSFMQDLVSSVFIVLAPDEYDRKYLDIDYKFEEYINNVGIPESGPMVSINFVVAPLRRTKTVNSLSLFGFEESPI